MIRTTSKAVADFLYCYAQPIILGLTVSFATVVIHLGWSLSLAAPAGVILVALLLGGLERLLPRRTDQKATSAETGRDIFFFGLSALASNAGRALALFIAVSLAGSDRLLGLPLWAEVILAVYVAEFFAYWLHRLSHSEGWLWKVHSIHHLPEKVNLTNNFLMHPLNIVFLKVARLTPLLLLGFSKEAVFIHGLFAMATAFSVHANIGGRIGFWNYLIGTAELHRLHHSKKLQEAGNHGTVVPLWDQVFGTFRYTGADPESLGVHERHRYPKTIVGMLLYPLGIGSGRAGAGEQAA